MNISLSLALIIVIVAFYFRTVLKRTASAVEASVSNYSVALRKASATHASEIIRDSLVATKQIEADLANLDTVTDPEDLIKQFTKDNK